LHQQENSYFFLLKFDLTFAFLTELCYNRFEFVCLKISEPFATLFIIKKEEGFVHKNNDKGSYCSAMIVDVKMPGGAGLFMVPGAVADMLSEGVPSVYLAVYIYTLRQLQSGHLNITNDAIAEALKISTIDVVNAFLFYSSRGLIKIHGFTSVDDTDFDVEFCFDTLCPQTPVPFRPSYKAAEISKRLRENPRMSQMYKIVSQMLGKTLSSADTELLYSFHDYYGLPIAVIVVMVEYYVSKGKRTMKYIEKEACKWSSAGIDTVEKAKNYIQKREEFVSYAGRVRAIAGINERRLTTRELDYINKWQNELSMPLDMVKLAYEKTVNQTGRLSFAYMNKILESWSKEQVTTSEQIVARQTKQKSNKGDARYDFDALQKQALQAVKHTAERKEANGI